jgi:hypothetical protein
VTDLRVPLSRSNQVNCHQPKKKREDILNRNLWSSCCSFVVCCSMIVRMMMRLTFVRTFSNDGGEVRLKQIKKTSVCG